MVIALRITESNFQTADVLAVIVSGIKVLKVTFALGNST